MYVRWKRRPARRWHRSQRGKVHEQFGFLLGEHQIFGLRVHHQPFSEPGRASPRVARCSSLVPGTSAIGGRWPPQRSQGTQTAPEPKPVEHAQLRATTPAGVIKRCPGATTPIAHPHPCDSYLTGSWQCVWSAVRRPGSDVLGSPDHWLNHTAPHAMRLVPEWGLLRAGQASAAGSSIAAGLPLTAPERCPDSADARCARTWCRVPVV